MKHEAQFSYRYTVLWRHHPEDHDLNFYRRENLKSRIMKQKFTNLQIHLIIPVCRIQQDRQDDSIIVPCRLVHQISTEAMTDLFSFI
jgi:hypothetical protein